MCTTLRDRTWFHPARSNTHTRSHRRKLDLGDHTLLPFTRRLSDISSTPSTNSFGSAPSRKKNITKERNIFKQYIDCSISRETAVAWRSSAKASARTQERAQYPPYHSNCDPSSALPPFQLYHMLPLTTVYPFLFQLDPRSGRIPKPN